MKSMSKRWLLAAAFTIVAVAAVVGSQALDGSGGDALAGTTKASVRAGGLGPISGLLPRDHLTEESAIQVDLSKESVRLPLYKGRANGQTVWYTLLDASDQGIAHDLGVNYAPKLANIAIGCPECVQTVTLDSPTPARTSSDRRSSTSRARRTSARPGSPPRARRLPLAKLPARRRRRPRIQPVHPHRRAHRPSTARRSSRPATAHSTSPITPTPATACSASTSPGRRLRASTPSRGSTCSSSRASTRASRSSTSAPTPASPRRWCSSARRRPALDKAVYNGGDDFLGSARERLWLHQRPDRRVQQGVTGIRASGQRWARL